MDENPMVRHECAEALGAIAKVSSRVTVIKIKYDSSYSYLMTAELPFLRFPFYPVEQPEFPEGEPFKRLLKSSNNKWLLDEAEHDIKNYPNRGQCFLPKPKAEADNIDRGLNNSWYYVKSSPVIVLLYI